MAKVLEGPGMGLMKKWGIHVPNYVVVTSVDELTKLGQANDWMKTSKLVAKIASDLHKPDGLLEIAPEEVAAFLEPLPYVWKPYLSVLFGDIRSGAYLFQLSSNLYSKGEDPSQDQREEIPSGESIPKEKSPLEPISLLLFRRV